MLKNNKEASVSSLYITSMPQFHLCMFDMIHPPVIYHMQHECHQAFVSNGFVITQHARLQSVGVWHRHWGRVFVSVSMCRRDREVRVGHSKPGCTCEWRLALRTGSPRGQRTGRLRYESSETTWPNYSVTHNCLWTPVTERGRRTSLFKYEIVKLMWQHCQSVSLGLVYS